MPRSAASDLGLHYLLMSIYGTLSTKGLIMKLTSSMGDIELMGEHMQAENMSSLEGEIQQGRGTGYQQ